jgi:lysine 2,3-aminomutase
MNMMHKVDARSPGRSADWRRLLATGCVRSTDLTCGGIDAAQLAAVTARFPMRINAYFNSLIHSADDPLGRQVIPAPAELEDGAAPLDPLGEEQQSPASHVIHRYPQRAVLLVSNQCAVYCRFCTRKRRMTGAAQVPPEAIAQGLAYIAGQTEINEVVLSGGDPLMLPDDRLLDILTALRRIPHVRLLRIHTRMPCVLPQRITTRLARALARYQPLYINIHFNHATEITAPVQAACARLADAGIALGSQTVLLKGVNDHPAVLARLMFHLLEIRVRPYYLHQLDRVQGTAHFQVPLERALELVATLRGPLSGLAVPHLMIDLPGGGGKIALTPDMIIERTDDCWWFRNWQGRRYAYACR